MTYSQELTDQVIKDTLVDYKVITKKRTKKCGSWMNKRTGIDKHIIKPFQYRCNYYECRICRRKKNHNIHIEHIKMNRSIREQGGEHLLITLTIPTSIKEPLQDIYKRFRKSLSGMRNNGVWRKLLRDTNCKYFYDKWEIPKDNKNHLHLHMVFAVVGNVLPIEQIRNTLYKTWKYYTEKNGCKKLSENYGVYISLPKKPDQEIDDYLYWGYWGKDGRLEKLEELFTQSKLEMNEKFARRVSVYKSTGLTEKQIVKEIQDINTCFRGSIRGRIHHQQ